MKVGYIRVSSKGQQSNHSLELQRNSVKNAGAEIIIEEVYTGGTVYRPKFSKLVKDLKDGDELIVTKLDRFARTVAEGSTIAQNLYYRNISLNILNIGKIENSTIGTLLLNVLLSFAQFEKDMINERCRDGKLIAKQNPNFREGRPKKYRSQQIQLALNLLKDKTYKEVEQMTGISKSTLIRAKREKTYDTELWHRVKPYVSKRKK